MEIRQNGEMDRIIEIEEILIEFISEICLAFRSFIDIETNRDKG